MLHSRRPSMPAMVQESRIPQAKTTSCHSQSDPEKQGAYKKNSVTCTRMKPSTVGSKMNVTSSNTVHVTPCGYLRKSRTRSCCMLHTRKKLGVFGAVCVREGRLLTYFENTFNTVTLQSFLEYVLQHRTPGRLMVLILDNARWHHANLIQLLLMEHRHMIQLDFLPPYSPELNPIERLWKLTTHNRYFPIWMILPVTFLSSLLLGCHQMIPCVNYALFLRRYV